MGNDVELLIRGGGAFGGEAPLPVDPLVSSLGPADCRPTCLNFSKIWAAGIDAWAKFRILKYEAKGTLVTVSQRPDNADVAESLHPAIFP